MARTPFTPTEVTPAIGTIFRAAGESGSRISRITLSDDPIGHYSLEVTDARGQKYQLPPTSQDDTAYAVGSLEYGRSRSRRR